MGREQLPAEPAGWCLSLRCLIPDTGNDLPWALVAVTRRFPLVVTVAWTVRPIYTLGTPELSERGSDHPGLQSGAGLPAPPHTAVLWFWTSVSPACPRSAPPRIPPPWVPGSCARSESGERRTLAAASGMPGAGLPSSGAGPPGRPEPVWPRDPDQPVAVHPKRSGSPRAMCICGRAHPALAPGPVCCCVGPRGEGTVQGAGSPSPAGARGPWDIRGGLLGPQQLPRAWLGSAWLNELGMFRLCWSRSQLPKWGCRRVPGGRRLLRRGAGKECLGESWPIRSQLPAFLKPLPTSLGWPRSQDPQVLRRVWGWGAVPGGTSGYSKGPQC